MCNTILSIQNDKFLINNKFIYSELNKVACHGLLMNARFIQGVFDEIEDVGRFNRFGRNFDVNQNTDELIGALESWYKKGLRGITVGFQGGGPCFTIDNKTMTNHPYYPTSEGMNIDEAYKERMTRIIKAADALGMIVIVSCFYPGQIFKFNSGVEIVESVKAVCRYLNQLNYKNIILEICNEYDACTNHPIVGSDEGVSTLIHIAKENLVTDIPVGSSLTGGQLSKEVAQASDVIFIHGNGCSRQAYYSLIQLSKQYAMGKPIICNEDSQCIGNMVVSMNEGVSWGYYNNLTKQEPPVDWMITEGEDRFFADRMSMELGILDVGNVCYDDKIKATNFYLQGIENRQKINNHRWIRLASLYPETIDFVEFYRNDILIFKSYVEPFSVNYRANWIQDKTMSLKGDTFKAIVYLTNQTKITLCQTDQID